MKCRCCTNSCIVVKVFLTRSPLNVALPSLAGEDFEAFLHRTVKEILDHVVREVISELDRIIFDEEASDVTV